MSSLLQLKNHSIEAIAVGKYGYRRHRKYTERYPYLVGPDDKVFVKRGNQDFEIYWSSESENDNGTIIDFVMARENCSFGEACKAIRNFFKTQDGASPNYDNQRFQKSGASTKKINFLVKYQYQDCLESDYLGSRGIKKEVLESKRFRGSVKNGKGGVALFPHRNRDGYCGWEARGPSFKGFAKGGTKGLWLSNCFVGDDTLVIAESAIDAISYAVLYPNSATRYVSIAGRPSSVQRELLAGAIAKVSHVLTVFDQGVGGDFLRCELDALNTIIGRKISHQIPAKKDFNFLLAITQRN